MLHIFFITTIIRPTFVPSNLIEIMKKKNAHWLFISIIVLGFTSCLDENYFQEQFEKRYNKQWENIFGKMDPNHDWNIIQQVNATVQVSEAGEHTLRIYTDHPKNKQSRLIAQIPVEGTGTIRFDLEKISKDVYARVKDAQGKVTFEGYFAVNGGEVLIEEGNIVSRLASRAVSGRDLNNVKEHNIGTVYRDGNNEENELRPVTSTNTVDLGKLYYFDNQLDFNSSTDRICLNFRDSIYPIIHNGNDAIFQEMKDNRNHMNTKGVEYVTISEDEIELSYIYGATGLYNSFGYFYWDPKTDGEDGYKNARKFILVNNACPQNNIKAADNKETTWGNAIQFNEGMGIAFEYFMKGNVPSYIYGTKYKLVYYGKNYEITDGTYTFPKDIHIGFFLYTTYWDSQASKDESNYLPDTPGNYAYSTKAPLEADNQQYRKNLVYSIPQYNNFIKENYNYRINENDYRNENQKENSGVDPNSGEISAVTYKYQGRKFLGFEDGVDKDMNDILLLVDADVKVVGEDGNVNDFEEQDKNYVDPNPEPEEPQAQSWIIACEDMGNIGDYDFNDAVFKVSHVAGTNQLKVTPLAAGGTYSIIVKYKDQNISTYTGQGEKDFHQLINSNASGNNGLWQQINDKSKGNAGAEITITDDALTNFSITNHDFSVYVEKNSYASVTITQPEHKNQQAPQMLVLPEYWIWPYEGRSIHLGYSGFQAWTNNQSENEDWYTKPDKTQSNGHLVDYNSFSNYPNNGEGGGNSGQASITVKVDNETKDNLEIYNDGFQKIDIPLSYFTGNNGAEIIFTSTTVINPNSNVGSQLGGTQGDGNRNIDIMNNKLTLEARDITYRRNQGLNKIEIFLPSNSNYGITAISITNKNTNTGGGESSEWMEYYSNDNKTATIPKSVLPIGNNGIQVTVTIDGNASNIVFNEQDSGQNTNKYVWTEGSSTTLIPKEDFLDKITTNLIIKIEGDNSTITNIEISAAN